jgi:hypothetical protein
MEGRSDPSRHFLLESAGVIPKNPLAGSRGSFTARQSSRNLAPGTVSGFWGQKLVSLPWFSSPLSLSFFNFFDFFDFAVKKLPQGYAAWMPLFPLLSAGGG